MSLYFQHRDFSLLHYINDELLNKYIEQKCAVYKIELSQTNSNIYGESINKIYKDACLVNCLIDRNDQSGKMDEFGYDVERPLSFRFFRNSLIEVDLVLEVGDIIEFNDQIYEIITLVENQYWGGKYPEYSYSQETNDRGASISIIANCIWVREDKINLKRTRL